MTLPRSLFILTFALTMLAALTRPVAAQQPTPPGPPGDDDVNRVARQLYCPVCENVSLDVCPTTACAQWREQIRQKMAEGLSDEEIKAYFAAQYGDRVLAEPPRRGLNWLVYLLPPFFFLLGVWVLYGVLRRARRKASVTAAVPPQPPAGDDVYLERLEEELRRRNQNR